MKALFTLILLTTVTNAQEWKPIKELSGPFPGHKGFSVETSASGIARGNDIIKLTVRFDFPWGAPPDLFRSGAPQGFDITSITRIETRFEFNCKTLVVKTNNSSATVYRFDGKKYKSKEPPFSIESSHIFSQYFCERGSVPIKPPTLKPK